jgi:hypothetical protein
MRLSLRDGDGREIESATAADPEAAVQQAILLLVRQPRVDVGTTLCIDEDALSLPKAGTLMTISAGNLGGLAARLERHAAVVDSSLPMHATDLRIAARLCRHALKAGWIRTSIAV